MALLFIAVHSLTQLGDPQMRKPVPGPQVVGMPQQTPVASEVPQEDPLATSYAHVLGVGQGVPEKPPQVSSVAHTPGDATAIPRLAALFEFQ